MDEMIKTNILERKNIVEKSHINAGGPIIIGDNNTMILGKSHDYGELLTQIKEVEMDLKDLPLDKIDSRLRKGKRLAELTKQKNDFEADVIRLAETFTKIEINTKRLRQAKEHFDEGSFREADAILKAEAMSHEQNSLLYAKERETRKLENTEKKLRNNSSEFLIKAQITATNYRSPTRFKDTCSYFEQAIKSHASFDNQFKYAKFLQDHNQFNKASQYYEQILKDFSDTLDPTNKARTLNNLGNLQSNNNELDKAEQSYSEALDIRRDLAKGNPQAFLPHLAETFNNLGNLQKNNNELDKAEQSYNEALGIYRTLAKENPQAYLPGVAITLNNLGNLQSNNNELDKAEQSYSEALDIRRDLAKNNPQAFLPDVAMTLNNMGNLQSNKNELDRAEESYSEALDIRRDLAKGNPQAFLPDLAMTLSNFSIFYLQNITDKEKSIGYAKETIKMLKRFAAETYMTQQYLNAAHQVLKAWES